MQKQPIANHAYVIGKILDWNQPGNPGVPVGLAPLIEEWRMPINRNNKRRNGKFVPGGNWLSMKYITTTSGDSLKIFREGYDAAYEGMRYPTSGISGYVSLLRGYFQGVNKDSWISDLEGYGATGWARARPAQPDFSFAGSFLELKDLPGMLKRNLFLLIRKICRAKGISISAYLGRRRRQGINSFAQYKQAKKRPLSRAADFHLAVQFGWLPLLRDIRKFVSAFKTKNKSLQNLIKHEGRSIRRERTLVSDDYSARPETTVNYSTPYATDGLKPILVTQCYAGGNAKREIHRGVKTTVKFVGSFKYFLPSGPRDGAWVKKMHRRIMGGQITPGVVWNLMPWTFLVDYFTTLGDFFEAGSRGVEDRLYCEWCYITKEYSSWMEQHTTEYVRTASSGKTAPQKGVVRLECLIKSRARCGPFGIRIRDSVTPKQQAIIAALTASKTRW
jgi:hypothetical protein